MNKELLFLILDEADSLIYPETSMEFWGMTVDFKSKNGWIFGLFYDCDEFDYIDYIIDQQGNEIDIWDENNESFEFATLRCWRGDSQNRKETYLEWIAE